MTGVQPEVVNFLSRSGVFFSVQSKRVRAGVEIGKFQDWVADPRGFETEAHERSNRGLGYVGGVACSKRFADYILHPGAFQHMADQLAGDEPGAWRGGPQEHRGAAVSA